MDEFMKDSPHFVQVRRQRLDDRRDAGGILTI